MESLFNNLHKRLKDLHFKKAILKNNKLTTRIYNFCKSYDDDLLDLSNAFNNVFEDGIEGHNCINCFILQDNKLFEELQNYLINAELFETDLIKKFNEATKSSSIVKCSSNKSFYIMKCYDYFFYLFNKNLKESIIVINNNKKAISMINVLLLTPYLMYGELNAIHGGLVNKGNINIVINNASLGGKTTFAILFAQDGWNIVTEENTYISKSGKILPYNIRNYFNIRAGTYLAFEDFFLKKNIVFEPFLSLKGKNPEELFEYGKNNQLSITFKELGTSFKFNNQKITHGLKVSILKNSNLIISKGDVQDLVNSFACLSSSPTVELFQELLDSNIVDIRVRKSNLTSILNNVKNFTITTGLDYIENFKYIKDMINVNQ